MDWTADGKLALTIRKGEVWLLGGVLDPKPDKVTYQLFASGLHEPLGLLRDGKDLLVTQRTETTRLRDTNGDGVADEYLTAGAGWNVSGSYHGYAYGPKRDGSGPALGHAQSSTWATTRTTRPRGAVGVASWIRTVSSCPWRPACVRRADSGRTSPATCSASTSRARGSRPPRSTISARARSS